MTLSIPYFRNWIDYVEFFLQNQSRILEKNVENCRKKAIEQNPHQNVPKQKLSAGKGKKNIFSLINLYYKRRKMKIGDFPVVVTGILEENKSQSKPNPQILDTTDIADSMKNEIRLRWKLFMREQTTSNLESLEQAIEKLEACPKIEVIKNIKIAFAEQCLQFKKKKKREVEGVFFLNNIYLFHFDEEDTWKVIHIAAGIQTYKKTILKMLQSFPTSEDKERLLKRLVSRAPLAQLFLESLTDFGLEVANPSHKKILLIAAKNCIDFNPIHFDFSKKEQVILFKIAFRAFLETKSQGTIFVNPPPFLFQHPFIAKLRPLFYLAQAMSPSDTGIPISSQCYEQDFLKSYSEALQAIEENACPEFGKTLSNLLQKNGTEKILRKMGKMKQEEDNSQIRAKELVKTLNAFAFDEILKSYLTIFANAFEEELVSNETQFSLQYLTNGIRDITSVFKKNPLVCSGLIAYFTSTASAQETDETCRSLYSSHDFGGLLPVILLVLKKGIKESTHPQFYQDILDFITNNAEWIKTHFHDELCLNIANKCVEWSAFKGPLLSLSAALAFLFTQVQLLQIEGSAAEKIKEPLQLVMITLSFLLSDEKSSLELEADVLTKNADLLIQKMLEIFLNKFGFSEYDGEKLLDCLKNWEKPHLIMNYYLQWVRNKGDIAKLIARWFRSVVCGQVHSLRFVEGKNGEYFSQFNKKIVDWYKKEITINPKNLQFLNKQDGEIKNFVAKFKKQFSALLIWDDLSPSQKYTKEMWNEKIKKIKKSYFNDPKMQNSETARLKLLQNLVALEQEAPNYVAKLILIQEIMGKNRTLWSEKYSYNKEQFIALNRQIERLKSKASGSANSIFDSITLRFTHCPEAAFTISDKTIGSCQSVANAPYTNRALVGRLINGKQKLFILEDRETAQPIAVATVKLLLDKKTKAPVLLKEPIYQCKGCTLLPFQIEEIVTVTLAQECRALGIPLLIGKTNLEKSHFERFPSSLFTVSPYKSPVLSMTGEAQIEYEDTNRMGVQTGSEYIIPSKLLLQVTLIVN